MAANAVPRKGFTRRELTTQVYRGLSVESFTSLLCSNIQA
jgi:hypothetical protein